MIQQQRVVVSMFLAPNFFVHIYLGSGTFIVFLAIPKDLIDSILIERYKSSKYFIEIVCAFKSEG